VVGTLSVSAESAEEALEKARMAYRDGQFVLEPGEVQQVKLAVVCPDGEQTEWVEM